jgi:prevent-host-death family protein
VSKRYSIAEARHNLAAIVHQLEHDSPVELTRRGEPVAVLLSTETYRRLLPTTGFWEAYTDFRTNLSADDLVGAPDLFADLRDRSPGREAVL